MINLPCILFFLFLFCIPRPAERREHRFGGPANQRFRRFPARPFFRVSGDLSAARHSAPISAYLNYPSHLREKGRQTAVLFRIGPRNAQPRPITKARQNIKNAGHNPSFPKCNIQIYHKLRTQFASKGQKDQKSCDPFTSLYTFPVNCAIIILFRIAPSRIDTGVYFRQ